MTQKLRVGAVNYLNTKPLIHELTTFSPDIDLSLEVPSKLADQLKTGELDVGLIPVIEYFRGDNYSVVPDVSIASQGAVLSVTLFSRVPWNRIRSVALDVGSRTSVALTKILLQKRYQTEAEFCPLALDQNPEEVQTDAVLLIGDRAMHACLPGYEHAYDLGQEWQRWTGLPFVYAFWAVRDGVDLGSARDAFVKAKERGRQNVGYIAQAEAPRLGLDAGFCRRYLETVISFDLGTREIEGLHRYYELASELGLAPAGETLRLYEDNLASV